MTRNPLEKIVSGARKAILPIVAATAMAYNANASLIKDVEFGQNDGTSATIIYLQNNDNSVTYDSAELKYDALLDSVAQSVKDNNPDYLTKTLAEIKDEWNVGILSPQAGGEVETGWTANRDGNLLNLEHAPFGYDKWLSDDSSKDELVLYVGFGDQLDYNNNGLLDQNEQLSWTGPIVPDAFTGYDQSGLGFRTDANSIEVIPEPRAIGLIALAGAGLVAARRILKIG